MSRISNSTYTNPEVDIMYNPEVWKIHDNCSHEPNVETLEVMAEMEESREQIKSGDRSGVMSFEDFMTDLYSDDEDDN